MDVQAVQPSRTIPTAAPTAPPPPAERPKAQERPKPQERPEPTERPEPQAGGTSAPPRVDQVELSSPRLAFSVEEGGDIVVRMFDRGTGELIRQIPPEARIRMAADIADIQKRFSV